MPEKYGKPAIEMARKLYHEHGGGSFDLIQAKMRKQYPKWNKSTLHDRKGRNGEVRAGWITLYNFEDSLARYEERLTTAVHNNEQSLYLGIKRTREALEKKVDDSKATKDEIYQYRDFCKLEIDARKSLDLSRDNLDTFVSAFEKIATWIGEIDPKGAKVLIKHGPRLAELAEAHYGKQQQPEENESRAGDREDEGSDEPPSGLRLVK